MTMLGQTSLTGGVLLRCSDGAGSYMVPVRYMVLVVDFESAARVHGTTPRGVVRRAV